MIRYLYTLQTKHHKSSFPITILSYVINRKVLLTVVTMLYITFHYLFILWLEVCASWSPSPILPTLQSPSSLQTTKLFSASVSLIYFVLFVGLICFLNSTYMWNHRVFVFLCLTCINIIPSRSNHTRFHFFMAE